MKGLLFLRTVYKSVSFGSRSGASTLRNFDVLKSTKSPEFNAVSYAGGGWTLVVSVSSSNRHHLMKEENNCFNSSVCVPYEDVVSLPDRKVKDEDIQRIASAYDGMKKRLLAKLLAKEFTC